MMNVNTGETHRWMCQDIYIGLWDSGVWLKSPTHYAVLIPWSWKALAHETLNSNGFDYLLITSTPWRKSSASLAKQGKWPEYYCQTLRRGCDPQTLPDTRHAGADNGPRTDPWLPRNRPGCVASALHHHRTAVISSPRSPPPTLLLHRARPQSLNKGSLPHLGNPLQTDAPQKPSWIINPDHRKIEKWISSTSK